MFVMRKSEKKVARCLDKSSPPAQFPQPLGTCTVPITWAPPCIFPDPYSVLMCLSEHWFLLDFGQRKMVPNTSSWKAQKADVHKDLRSVPPAHRRIFLPCTEGRRKPCCTKVTDFKFPISCTCNLPCQFLIVFLGKLTEKIANSNHMIAGHLTTSCKCEQIAKPLKCGHITRGNTIIYNSWWLFTFHKASVLRLS